jgi:hypothetical protein
MNIVTSEGNIPSSYLYKNWNPSDKTFATTLNMENLK